MGINIKYLKNKLRLAGHTPDEAAKAMGMNRATYYRKLKAEGVKFTIEEMQRLINFLNLTNEEALIIFFNKTNA